MSQEAVEQCSTCVYWQAQLAAKETALLRPCFSPISFGAVHTPPDFVCGWYKKTKMLERITF